MAAPEEKHRNRHKPGTAPGTLVAPKGAPFPKIHVMAWDEDNLVEQDVSTAGEVEPLLKKWRVVWINIDGLGSAEIIEKFGELLNMHPLVLEDILGLHQRPKTEDYGDQLFLVTRMADLRGEFLATEQVSLFIGKNFVISFQETVGDCFDPVRERIRFGKGRRVRFSRPDYLAYAILDAIIDGYFPILDHYNERLNTLEDKVVENPHRNLIHHIHGIKRDLHLLRHNLWPMREMVNGFADDEEIVSEETRTYLRDCHDHIIQVLDILETYRERASGMIDIYLSSVSNKLNEVMQVLTIIATIFIPLSFIASVYGMNFDTAVSPWNMPELHWAYGYPFALGLMAATAGGLLLWFRRKGWFGRKND